MWGKRKEERQNGKWGKKWEKREKMRGEKKVSGGCRGDERERMGRKRENK